jgi:hypothetical protein
LQSSSIVNVITNSRSRVTDKQQKQTLKKLLGENKETKIKHTTLKLIKKKLKGNNLP